MMTFGQILAAFYGSKVEKPQIAKFHCSFYSCLSVCLLTLNLEWLIVLWNVLFSVLQHTRATKYYNIKFKMISF